MSTAYLKAQVLENNICLNSIEIDYFLNQDLLAKHLSYVDSLNQIKILRCDSMSKLKDIVILNLKENEKDLKSQVLNQKLISNNIDLALQKKTIQYNNKLFENKILKSTTIGLIFVAICEGIIIYFKTK